MQAGRKGRYKVQGYRYKGGEAPPACSGPGEKVFPCTLYLPSSPLIQATQSPNPVFSEQDTDALIQQIGGCGRDYPVGSPPHEVLGALPPGFRQGHPQAAQHLPLVPLPAFPGETFGLDGGIRPADRFRAGARRLPLRRHGPARVRIEPERRGRNSEYRLKTHNSKFKIQNSRVGVKTGTRLPPQHRAPIQPPFES
jgi:hypothetical protein